MKRETFGWEIETEFGPRGIITPPSKTATGNIVLRAGNENIDTSTGFRRSAGWSTSVHIVLTPDEAAALSAALDKVLR